MAAGSAGSAAGWLRRCGLLAGALSLALALLLLLKVNDMDRPEAALVADSLRSGQLVLGRVRAVGPLQEPVGACSRVDPYVVVYNRAAPSYALVSLMAAAQRLSRGFSFEVVSAAAPAADSESLAQRALVVESLGGQRARTVHVSPDPYQPAADPTAVAVNLLFDPVWRAAATFAQRRPGESLEACVARPFDEWPDCGVEANGQAAVLAGGGPHGEPAELLAAAQAAVQAHVAVLGRDDRMAESLRVLEMRMPYYFSGIQRAWLAAQNASAALPAEPTRASQLGLQPDTALRLHDANHVDYALREWASLRLDEQLAACPTAPAN